ncbi:MAG: hypothetical protein MPW14_08735 [Candidatus Manganitrophus sp.]|nr:MAG: hypothetical protein MPW14_08735 [Candidatus Manganitrophus sp.]
MRFQAAQAEDDIAVAFARQILGGVERFVQGDAEAALEQHRHLALASGGLEQFEVLRVAGADLQHHAGGVPGAVQRLLDLLDVGLAGDFHGNHADAVFSGELEHPGQAGGAMALEGIGAGARLVGAHACAHLPCGLQCAHHRLDVLGGVDRAQPREDLQRILPEMHAVVDEFARAVVVLMAAEDAIGFGHPDHPFHRREGGDQLPVDCGGVSDQIDLGEPLRLPLNDMFLDANVRKGGQVGPGLLESGAVLVDMGV